MSRLCLTIDWDFFLPSARLYWGVGEENVYNMTERWKAHKLGNKIKTEGVEDFWKWIKKWFKFPERIFVSESHIVMFDLLGPHHKVISFDSHHDCYDNIEVDCGSWGTFWLRKNPTAEMLWISQFPEDKRVGMSWMNMAVSRRVRMFKFDEIAREFNEMYFKRKKKMRLDFVHICRSGTWSPPQFDGEFAKFLKDSGCEIEVIPDYTKINPLENRMEMLEEVSP